VDESTKPMIYINYKRKKSFTLAASMQACMQAERKQASKKQACMQKANSNQQAASRQQQPRTIKQHPRNN